MDFINGNSQDSSDKRPVQLKLWDRPSFDPTDRLKSAMREALKDCSLSREQVVSQMNHLAQLEGLSCAGRSQEVTLPVLEKWVAAGAFGYRIPVHYLPIFCKVTGSLLPLQALGAPLSVTMISGEEMKLLEWARTEMQKRKLSKKARILAEEVGL